ncbi:hypothetical protein ACQ4PT_016469 [Festuca glaucescens]
MVAHAESFCNAAATMTSSTTTTRRPAPFAAVAPRPSSRNTKTGRAKKARTGRRRCKEVIGSKMEALRRLVPSNDDETEADGVDELLFRAADYIVRLQAQVRVMQHMVDVLEEHTKDS